MSSHPEIVAKKKLNSPDEDKSVRDAKLLITTLKNFFAKHPMLHSKNFSLGSSI